ncbi:MAG: aminodeoxychorismate lyase [Enterobacterales bacterium]|nr:aminodeoxychorismate lyase [Enterobacterales bacterium]
MQFEIQDNRQSPNQFDPAEMGAGNSPIDRAALFGDGFFTTGRIIDGKIDALTHHVERIEHSLEGLKFPSANPKSIIDKLQNACTAINHAGFRLSVSRQQVTRGYAIDHQATILVNLQLFDLPKLSPNACELIIADTPVSVNAYLAGIKHLNRLDNVLAASEITKPNQEALMFNDDELICGSRSNIFLKIDSKWLTPLLHNAGIEGITKKRVSALLRTQGIRFESTKIHRQTLYQVEAAFVTNSLIGVWPVEQLVGRTLDLADAKLIQSWFLEQHQGYL